MTSSQKFKESGEIAVSPPKTSENQALQLVVMFYHKVGELSQLTSRSLLHLFSPEISAGGVKQRLGICLRSRFTLSSFLSFWETFRTFCNGKKLSSYITEAKK